MAGNRTEPPQPGQSPPAPRRQEPDRGPEEPAASAEQQRRERCGPVAIARRRKGDGRALILYTREERRRT